MNACTSAWRARIPLTFHVATFNTYPPLEPASRPEPIHLPGLDHLLDRLAIADVAVEHFPCQVRKLGVFLDAERAAVLRVQLSDAVIEILRQQLFKVQAPIKTVVAILYGHRERSYEPEHQHELVRDA